MSHCDADPGHSRTAIWVIPAILLSIGTLVFVTSDVDRGITGGFYRSDSGWVWKDFPLFVLLYDHGTMPAILLTLAACALLFTGLFSDVARRWRKIAAYFVLVMVIAPGILVNAVFKEHWGRPRPREVTDFGGRHVFEKVWQYDAASPGKSFPSGHASMGFGLFALFFIGRALHKRWANAAALAAIVLGTLLGLARVAQGGHFASDVLWSAGFCYFVALLLARMMRLEQSPYYTGARVSRAGWAVLALVAAGTAALAVGVPYHEEKRIAAPDTTGMRKRIEVELDEAQLVIRAGEQFRFEAHAEAFGAFGSQLRDRLEVSQDGEVEVIKLRQAVKGWFANLEQAGRLDLPSEGGGTIELGLEDGGVIIELFAGEWDWKVDVGRADLTLRIPDDLPLKVTRASVEGAIENSVEDLEWSPSKGRWKRGENPDVKLRVSTRGKLRFERAAD